MATLWGNVQPRARMATTSALGQCESMHLARVGHTPGSASGWRRVIAVTLAQRAATGAMDCNHYAATLAMGQGATMQLARRTCGTCARLDKWLYLRSPWCSVHPQTRETTTTMQPQAHWAVALRCMRIAARVVSFSAIS